MTCEEVRISLGAHVLGALDAVETAEVEAHLETCAACRKELDELSGLPPLLALVSAEDIERAAAPPRAVLDGVVADVAGGSIGGSAGGSIGGSTGGSAGGSAGGSTAGPAVTPAGRGRRSRVLLALAASVVVAAVGGTAWLSAAQNAPGGETTVAGAAAAPDQASRAMRDEAGQGRTAEDRADQVQAGQAEPAGTDAPVAPLVAPASPAPSKGAVARKVQPPPADTTVTAAPEARGRHGDVTMAVRLDPHGGRTQIVARVAGVPAGTVCTLRAVAKNGTASTIGSWTVGRGEYRGQKMVLEGSTKLRLGQIDRFELADSGGRILVTATL
ncbi:zf-HC2 domain-containing protein [Microbispora sp. NPDC088329]|uniref:anti-sigma factor family protein n=1 Tax=Microbispora sp. NPDC088329 TaxID=3154869 RepID=UPI00342AE18E